MSISVLVVEDEPLIAEAHRAYVARVPGFDVVASVNSGRDALRFVETAPVDLLLLDFYLPDMTGLDVCRTLRARGRYVDVIAVTSARDVDVVRAAVSLGVVQYLLKPFSFASFRDKLQRYAEYREHVAESVGAAAQSDVDRALGSLRGSRQVALPKGLAAETLQVVVDVLRTAPGPMSASEVGDAVGVSRVTVRRYLEHLVDAGSVERAPRYGRAGRPENGYAWRPAVRDRR